MPRPVMYSIDDILEMLRECQRRHGRCTPALFQQEDDFCSVSLVLERFDSWLDAKQKAGIGEDLRGKVGCERRYSDEEILEHLRELKRREGKVTAELLNEHMDLCGSTVIQERFGGIVAGKEAAGVGGDARSNNQRPREHSDEQMLEMLRRCEEKHGKCSKSVFDEDDAFCSSGAIRKRFGTWSRGKELAEVGGTPDGYKEGDQRDE